MKLLRRGTIGLLALAIWMLAGCLEVSVTTTISEDGSTERTVAVKRQAKMLPAYAYPVPSGRGWTSEWRETGEKELPFEYVARKRFATPEELSAEYTTGPDSGGLEIAVTVKRTSGWFHSTVDYRETYSLTNPFEILPAQARFTPEEINRIARGEKSDSLNKKLEEWDYRNTFEEFYARLIRAVGDGDAAVNRARLEGAKEEMFRLSREDTVHAAGDPLRHSLNLLAKALNSSSSTSFTSTTAIDRYRGAVARATEEVDSMLERRKSADRWISTVSMPGALVSANGETLEGGEVRWQIESKQLLVSSVFMAARSSVTNTWAFVATGALILLAPVVFGILLRRSRRKLRP